MNTSQTILNEDQARDLSLQIKAEGKRLGFQQIGVTDTDLSRHIPAYQAWLENGYHANLDYMEKHGSKRWQADELIPGTLRVISVRMDYMSDPEPPITTLNQSDKAYISRYSLGRDYHKLIRSRLKKLIDFIEERAQAFDFRAFVDSAPVLERAFAQKAGLGWFGKNTMLINRSAGSWFFLGEIYTDLPLPIDPPYDQEHCGRCTACLDICPTQAFKGPYILDSKRCISYLTIELKGSIPLELRPKMGNRIFGCDDCQLVCPWNRFSEPTQEEDFSPRHQLNTATLIELFSWDEATFLNRTEGSAIRRAGYESWLRNIAIAMGNAQYSEQIMHSLQTRLHHESAIIREHVEWAIEQLNAKRLPVTQRPDSD
jgi:epoxyqueuosine reductase